MAKRKLDPKLTIALVAVQAVIGALTVRDIKNRDKSQVRGPKLLWTLWGGSNTLGSLAYWLLGRKKPQIASA